MRYHLRREDVTTKTLIARRKVKALGGVQRRAIISAILPKLLLILCALRPLSFATNKLSSVQRLKNGGIMKAKGYP